MDSLKRDLLITIEKIWLKYPELRLGQIISNIVYEDGDVYFIDNDNLLKRLREEYEVK
jgi:hypothetical protein